MVTRLFGLILVAILWLGHPAFGADPFVFQHENVMGTSLELRIQAVDRAAAERAESAVLQEIDRLSALFSNHEPQSEFRRWQETTGQAVPVSAELLFVLTEADRWRLKSGGAFDARVQQLSRLWARAQKTGSLPTAAETAQARASLKMPAWTIDAAAHTAIRNSDSPLTLDAIAKGYIVERGCEAGLKAGAGVYGILLNIGGDLRAAGEIRVEVGVSSPLADSETSEPIEIVTVQNQAVATSGRSQRFFNINGQKYSHIFDPRTGAPARGAAGATVIAKNSADADAIATILNVLPPAQGLAFVESLQDVACLIVGQDSQVFRSRLWPSPKAMAAVAVVPPTSPVGPRGQDNSELGWGEDHELVIDFEIDNPGGNARRYRRPYVAIWVEDKNGKPVRTITLWLSLGGQGPDRWLPDLKKWHPADLERRKATRLDLVHTIARATRQPGKYTSIWDGKDDLGKPVAAGTYTLLIETAREHGTYQIIRQPITVGGEPFAEDLKGNVEIKSASLAYRKKTPAK